MRLEVNEVIGVYIVQDGVVGDAHHYEPVYSAQNVIGSVEANQVDALLRQIDSASGGDVNP